MIRNPSLVFVYKIIALLVLEPAHDPLEDHLGVLEVNDFSACKEDSVAVEGVFAYDSFLGLLVLDLVLFAAVQKKLGPMHLGVTVEEPFDFGSVDSKVVAVAHYDLAQLIVSDQEVLDILYFISFQLDDLGLRQHLHYPLVYLRVCDLLFEESPTLIEHRKIIRLVCQHHNHKMLGDEVAVTK